MALAGVESAIRCLGNMVVEEAKYLYKVEERVDELRNELKWMACFLQDVDAKRDRDARMREWIRQINRFSYQSEDIIETFVLKVELQRRGGLLNKLKRYSCIIRKAMPLHELGSDIDALKLRMSTLTYGLRKYGVKITKEGSSSSVKMELQLRKSYAHYVEDEKIIGLEKDVECVVENLKAEKFGTVAIYGVGGLGKTTLAKKVFHHKDIRRDFEAFAWASISQQCHARSVLVELSRGLTSKKAGDNETVDNLMERVHRVQQKKKCLVVLDDIWDNKAWDSLKKAFPFNQENSSGWKVVLTTRIKSVANYVDNNAYVHEQTLMTESNAWALLQRKIGGDPPHIVLQKHGPEAEKLAREMLKHCGGLPLAIAALGGILAAKKSLEEWKVVNKNIKSILSNAKDDGFSCKEVLELSYYHLPFYLKPCFLYLGIFPEDTEIRATKVIELWMAEGFLSTNSSDNEDYIDEQGSNSVELGEAYLAELVDRSMVQVGSTRRNGTIKTCRIHDLVRELCISKAAEENFLKVLTVGDSGTSSISRMPLPPPPLPDFTSNIRKEYRRLVVHGDQYDLQKLITGIVSNPNKKSNAQVHVHSLLLCGNFIHPKSDNVNLPRSSILIKAVIKQYRLLRVLCLDFWGMDSLPKEVGELVHLRYLSIGGGKVEELPSSIVKLKGLQTLDLRKLAKIKWFPDMIWSMRNLRHVYMPKYGEKPSLVRRSVNEIKLSKLHQEGQGGLLNHNMEVLCNFDGLLQSIKDVANLANLRKLSIIRKIEKKEDLEHIKNSKSLLNGRLKHLFFKLEGKLLIDEPSALEGMKGPDKMKLEIEVNRSWRSLELNVLPPGLTTLILSFTRIKDPDFMRTLEKLPNLRKLMLSSDSYMGRRMTCVDGGFPNLVYLRLYHLKCLEEWTIEKGAMPSLLRLSIWNCAELNKFSDGIKSIPKLKELDIADMPDDFCDEWREWKESAIERDDGDVKGGASGVEDGGLSDSDEVINHHIPTTDISDEMVGNRT